MSKDIMKQPFGMTDDIYEGGKGMNETIITDNTKVNAELIKENERLRDITKEIEQYNKTCLGLNGLTEILNKLPTQPPDTVPDATGSSTN
jgi:hypothetical protein